ncbi:MAG: hypothetical protein ACE5FH_10880 [Candidatus Zixiibacteriota bacterium]
MSQAVKDVSRKEFFVDYLFLLNLYGFASVNYVTTGSHEWN